MRRDAFGHRVQDVRICTPRFPSRLACRVLYASRFVCICSRAVWRVVDNLEGYRTRGMNVPAARAHMDWLGMGGLGDKLGRSTVGVNLSSKPPHAQPIHVRTRSACSLCCVAASCLSGCFNNIFYLLLDVWEARLRQAHPLPLRGPREASLKGWG